MSLAAAEHPNLQVITAKFVGDAFSKLGLFDAHLELKAVPLLHSDPTEPEVDILPASACAVNPVVCVERISNVQDLYNQLSAKTHSYFPVTSDHGR